MRCTRTSSLWPWLAGLLALVPLGALAAEPLPLREAQRLALERQPLLESYARAAAAAREGAVAEAQLPDPKLKAGVQNLPIDGADAFQLDGDDMTMTTIGVMQEMVPARKRLAAADRLRAEAAQAEAEGAASARMIRRDVALAWLDAFEAARQVETYRRLSEELAAERQVASRQLAAGGAMAAELFQLDAMRAMVNDQRLMAEGDARKARAGLARWLGEAATRPLPEGLPNLPRAASGAAESLEQHPMLESARRTQDVARSAAAQARAERQPNWGWELMYGYRTDERADMVTFQVTMDLPWDRPHRQDRRLAEKLALADRALLLAEDRRRQLEAELAAAQADWDTAQAREQEHMTRLIPAAQARLKTAQAAYAAGKAPLSAVWEARRGLLEVELEHWLIRTNQQRAAVRLAYLFNDAEDGL